MSDICACGCGASLAGMRADAVYASEACSKRARRADSPDKARTGPGSRGGNVRSVEQADYLHRQHKQQWTAKIRRHIARTLLETGRFFADDMAALEVPEEFSSIIGSQTATFAGQEFMVAIGRRRVEHKAANARKANVYEVTEKGRRELPKLVGVGSGVPSPQGTERRKAAVHCATADSDEPLSLLPDTAGQDRARSAFTDPEDVAA